MGAPAGQAVPGQVKGVIADPVAPGGGLDLLPLFTREGLRLTGTWELRRLRVALRPLPGNNEA